jgi:hypothetical protein
VKLLLRRVILGAAILSPLSTAACVHAGQGRASSAVVKPLAAVGSALPAGPESVYPSVNSGDWARADRLLHDVWEVPGFAPVTLPSHLSWREDPYADPDWRSVFYSLRPTSDLLWAYYRSGQVRYRDKLLGILRDYVAYDGTGRAPEPSTLDDPYALAFRTMILVNSYVKLQRSHDLPADLTPGLLRSIGRAAGGSAEPGNRLDLGRGLTQAAALLLVAANFPDLDREARWGDLGRARLSELIGRIVDADGVDVSTSPDRHFQVLDLGLRLVDWSQRGGIALPTDFRARLETMVRYATYTLWPDGTVPLPGSSVRMRPGASADLYAILTRAHPDFAFAVTAGRSGTAPVDRAVLFGRTGQAVLRSDGAGPRYADNTQVAMNVGPPSGAGGHLDALAVDYYSHGRVLLVGSGSNPNADTVERAFLRGTSAHNTVTVDGEDQRGGEVTAGLTMSGDGWAYQSGATTAYPGVTHRRSVLVLDRDLVIVADILSSAKPHRYEQLWHASPGAHLLLDGLRAQVYDEYDNPAVSITQASLGPPPQVQTSYGDTAPMQGWSHDHGRTQPGHVVDYVTRGTAASYLTLIASGRYAATGGAVTGTLGPDGIHAEVCADGFAADVDIAHQAATGESVTVRRLEGCVHAG